MTGRTHDLTAFTAINLAVVAVPLPQMTFATALAAVGGALIGGITPDIDQPTAKLWRKLPAGSIIGRIISPLLGGHRLISHSIVGIFLFGFLAKFLLNVISTVILVNMNIVWTAFMIGFISHLIMDTFTKEGVPWLFPIPFRFGLPPLKMLRVKTGGIVETAIIFPALLLLNIYVYYSNYETYLLFIKHLVH